MNKKIILVAFYAFLLLCGLIALVCIPIIGWILVLPVAWIGYKFLKAGYKQATESNKA